MQFSLLFSGHTGLPGLGGYASPPLVSYGQLVFSDFSVYSVFGTSRMFIEIVTLGQAGSTVILVAQLSMVIFVLREKFAFLFQTFSRNYPPGKAPPSRGRSV